MRKRRTGKTTETGGSKRGRRLLRKALAAFAVLALAFFVDYWAYPYGFAPDGKSLDSGENGLWLRYPWAFGEHSDAEIADLGRRLQDFHIRYAYFHVRSVKKSGELAYWKPEQARRLLATLRRAAPAVKSVAWVYAGNRRGRGEIDLANKSVRARMVRAARRLVTVCGFDGVQWDYEICADADPNFLALLKETRAALPPKKLISVATPMQLPAPLRRWGWSDETFRQVAPLCDQMVVMCYDSGFYLPRSYVWLVRQQAIRVTQDAAQTAPKCRVLLGVPTYDEGLPSHNPRSENIALALRGVREGMADSNAVRASFAGVALFADYTTDDAKWSVYRRLWLAR